MPLWLLRIVWAVRRKRAVLVHFKPSTGEDGSIEGVQIGRWKGHYVLVSASYVPVSGEPKAFDGVLEVPAENVLAVQVL